MSHPVQSICNGKRKSICAGNICVVCGQPTRRLISVSANEPLIVGTPHTCPLTIVHLCYSLLYHYCAIIVVLCYCHTHHHYWLSIIFYRYIVDHYLCKKLTFCNFVIYLYLFHIAILYYFLLIY